MTRAVAVFTEDDRQDLAQLAARAERANQPAHFLWLALVALAIALIVLFSAWRDRARAVAALDGQRAIAQRVVDAAGRLKALDQVGGTTTAPRIAEPDNFLISTIEAAGAAAGLKDRVPTPSTRKITPNGLSSQQFALSYTKSDPSLEALMRWVKRATEDVPGLEVSSFQLEPEPQAWRVKVTFTRWQRAEGT